jgi:hypothetical protein
MSDNTRFFAIQGYWKDDKTEINGYIVTDTDEQFEGVEDEGIFHYGIKEEDLKKAVEAGEDSEYEFVVESYEEVK